MLPYAHVFGYACAEAQGAAWSAGHKHVRGSCIPGRARWGIIGAGPRQDVSKQVRNMGDEAALGVPRCSQEVLLSVKTLVQTLCWLRHPAFCTHWLGNSVSTSIRGRARPQMSA